MFEDGDMPAFRTTLQYIEPALYVTPQADVVVPWSRQMLRPACFLVLYMGLQSSNVGLPTK
jgi:hypothetical protein